MVISEKEILMKTGRALRIATGLLLVLSVSLFAKEKTRYVKITKPYTNIYKQLDPESEVIQRAQKEDIFELIYKGKRWYKVRVDNSTGWIEIPNGIVVEKDSPPILSLILFFILLIGTIASASYLIYKQNSTSNEET